MTLEELEGRFFICYLFSKGIKIFCNRWISRSFGVGLVKFWIEKIEWIFCKVYNFIGFFLNRELLIFFSFFLDEIFIEEIGAMNFSHF